MSDIPESLGELTTGGLAARVAEPSAGENRQLPEHESCLNCGAALSDPYCAHCGQRGHVHRSLSGFFHDLLHGVLHFEGKIWRTLPVWVWRPGLLTREYIDGKRAKYISPIALFLFVVFVTYALFSALGGGIKLDPEGAPDAASIQAAYAEADQALAEKQAEIEAATGDPAELARLKADLAELKRERGAISVISDVAGVEVGEPADDGLSISGAVNESAVRKAWQKAQDNPQLLIYKLQTNAYKFAWLLIPLSAPFVWLLFPFQRRFRLYDHTVFVTYSIAFMLSLVGIASLSAYFNAAGLIAPLLLYAPFHLYRQLRGTYELSRFGALWRMLALSIFSWIAILLFVIGLTVAVSS